MSLALGPPSSHITVEYGYVIATAILRLDPFLGDAPCSTSNPFLSNLILLGEGGIHLGFLSALMSAPSRMRMRSMRLLRVDDVMGHPSFGFSMIF